MNDSTYDYMIGVRYHPEWEQWITTSKPTHLADSTFEKHPVIPDIHIHNKRQSDKYVSAILQGAQKCVNHLNSKTDYGPNKFDARHYDQYMGGAFAQCGLVKRQWPDPATEVGAVKAEQQTLSGQRGDGPKDHQLSL